MRPILSPLVLLALIWAAGPGLAAETDGRITRFVRDHAPELNQTPRLGVPRWGRSPFCVAVAGLKGDQNALVWSRINQVAKSAGVSLAAAGCRSGEAGVLFTTDFKDAVARESARRGQTAERAANNGRLIGWKEGSPIQAGYRAAGGKGAARIGMVWVVVDLNRVQGVPTAVITDYVAMLVLTMPRGLDRCNALPSITDLFVAKCPGHDQLKGLTPADTAFLGALYEDYLSKGVWDADEFRVARRMDERLPAAARPAVR
jgi:hypothetical protein